MNSFEQLKATLKEKWLDYYQVNAPWIKIFMLQSRGDNWIKVVNGRRRPHGDIILGAMTALEPKLIELMTPFCQLNSNPESLVEALGLNLDPEIELENRAALIKAQSKKAQIIPSLPESKIHPDVEAINLIREQIEKEKLSA